MSLSKKVTKGHMPLFPKLDRQSDIYRSVCAPRIAIPRVSYSGVVLVTLVTGWCPSTLHVKLVVWQLMLCLDGCLHTTHTQFNCLQLWSCGAARVTIRCLSTDFSWICSICPTSILFAQQLLYLLNFAVSYCYLIWICQTSIIMNLELVSKFWNGS